MWLKGDKGPKCVHIICECMHNHNYYYLAKLKFPKNFLVCFPIRRKIIFHFHYSINSGYIVLVC